MVNKKSTKFGICNYHLCRKRTKVYICEFCDNYFCEEHRNPKPPGLPRFDSTTHKDRLFMEEWHKPGGHPCTPYLEHWEVENNRKWEEYENALNEALRKHPSKHKENISLPSLPPPRGKGIIWILATILILGFMSWYLYNNPQLIQDIKEKISGLFNATNDIVSTVTTKKTMVVDIPYILSYPENKIYFQAQYKGKLNESSIGSPIKEMLQQGWKIDYKDYPAHNTTSQKITVEIIISQPSGSSPKSGTTPTGSSKPIITITRPVIDITSLEKQIHNLINDERRKNGLTGISWDDKLASIARGHSQDMANRGYFSHYDLEGHDIAYRYEKAAYTCSIYYKTDPDGTQWYATGAENIFQNNLYDTVYYINGIPTSYDWNNQDKIATSTVQGWMNSPGHRENILTSYWMNEGIGIAISSDDKVYITEDFC
jgi:uncharacterized protein YkwD